MAPSNQLDFPSAAIELTISTARKAETVSRVPNSKVSGTPSAHAMITIRGAMKTAIWVEDPIEIAKERSILSLPATVTAVKCSAAFPNNGRSMTPMKR